MSTERVVSGPPTISLGSILFKGFILLLVLFAGGLAFILGYWWGMGLILSALLIFFLFGFKREQGRNLLLFLYAHAAVVAVAGGLVFTFLVANQQVRQFSQRNDLTNLFLGNYIGVFFDSVVMGVIAAVVIVTVPFLLVAAAATVVTQYQHKDKRPSFWDAFLHTIHCILARSYFAVEIEGGERKGSEKDIERLNTFGGPGWLIVHPGHVVVLHYQGNITRVVGETKILLKGYEKIKAIFPLTNKAGPQTIDDVLTRDRIPLKLTVLHVAQLELAKDTKKRLQQAVAEAEKQLQTIEADPQASEQDKQAAQQKRDEAQQKVKSLENDKLVGDDNDQCYESIARLAARKAPKGAWEDLKNFVASNLRDVIMSEYAENLFDISGNNDLEARINQRKIAEIEKIVLTKARQIGLDDGMLLRVVDIQKVDFPEEIAEKINEEIKTQIQERIEQTEARIAHSKAEATITKAKADAQARILEGQGEGEAQVALFREILRELKRENVLSEKEIAESLLNFISSTTSLNELKSFFRATAFRPYDRQFVVTPEKTNGTSEKTSSSHKNVS
ncbi:MAG: hypothetical protein JW953_14785 [Anaerolineae bacterium]|nr:hypothetical protein [Anaerolineae bacterium]